MHAVIFDIDGTLLQSASIDDALYRDAVRFVLGTVKLRQSLEDYEFVSDSGVLAQIFADNAVVDDQKRIQAVKSRFVELLRLHIADNGPFPEIPGARNLLARFARSPDHSVAIATGGWRESALLKLQTSGFADFGFPLASSDDAYDRREIMRIALSRLGDGFMSITYYGDGPWDQSAAQDLGWTFVPVGSDLGGIESYDASTGP